MFDRIGLLVCGLPERGESEPEIRGTCGFLNVGPTMPVWPHGNIAVSAGT